MAENENLHHVSDGDFEQQILKADVPALVDFWAAWCGPCRTVGPVVEELATEYAGKVKIAKLNVDENPLTASQYAVQSIPTMIFFKDGKKGSSLIGVQPVNEIERHLKLLI